MTNGSRSFRWLQISLTVFYGQVIGNGIYQYLLQGIVGFISRQRTIYDSIWLFLLGLSMLVFVVYALFAVWRPERKSSILTCCLLILILILTVVKTIFEANYAGRSSLNKEWLVIRITELVLRVVAIFALVVFTFRMKEAYQAEEFEINN